MHALMISSPTDLHGHFPRMSSHYLQDYQLGINRTIHTFHNGARQKLHRPAGFQINVKLHMFLYNFLDD